MTRTILTLDAFDVRTLPSATTFAFAAPDAPPTETREHVLLARQLGAADPEPAAAIKLSDILITSYPLGATGDGATDESAAQVTKVGAGTLELTAGDEAGDEFGPFVGVAVDDDGFTAAAPRTGYDVKANAKV